MVATFHNISIILILCITIIIIIIMVMMMSIIIIINIGIVSGSSRRRSMQAANSDGSQNEHCSENQEVRDSRKSTTSISLLR
eukprot:s3108_g3.t1